MILDFEEMLKYYKKNSYNMANITENAAIFLIASDYQINHKNIFVVLDTLYEAQKYYDKLINMLSEDDVLFYPADELITSELLVSSIEFKLERNLTIKNLLSDKPHIIVTNLNGIIRKQMPRKRWCTSSVIFNKGDEINIDDLTRYLIESGYKKEYLVGKVGEFSIRGSIIDLFPLNRTNPIRLDLFDTEIEKIKEFDINSQRSINEIDSIEIIPLNEMFYDENELEIIRNYINSITNPSEKLEEILKTDLENLETRNDISLLRKYIGLISDETILDFVSDKKLFFINQNNLLDAYNRTINDLNEYNENLGDDSFRRLNFFYDFNELKEKEKIIYLDPFKVNKAFDLHVRDTEKFYGNLDLFIDYISRNQDKTIIVSYRDKKRMDLFKEMLFDKHINYEMLRKNLHKGLFLTLDNCALGVDFYDLDIVIFSEEDIYKRVDNKVRYKSVFGESKRIKTVDDINVGDYVVHYDYGIGRYLGIESSTRDNITRDYFKILYAGNEFLFVPLENIDSIMRYSNSNNQPRLNAIGGSSWAKTKEKVRKKLRDISDKLIKLYSERNALDGFKFSANDAMYDDFASDFTYEETLDQKQAIDDLIKDMESGKPTDRLICGDVGYGKTEVAMRGAFKAVYDHKQVAYLAPTTVLVNQHYNTFIDRFSKFGVRIEKISRLTPLSEQSMILNDLENGKIDIIIGTHRLLSKDIKFKDLGLLIVDEEQRFGVEHKERIKEMKVNVDTISLTATPIPRTLQMSMIGIKDLSVIQTPPKNRYPVQTYVIGYHKAIVKEAIERELARGGQVFYLHNKVSDIIEKANEIQMLVPYSRVSYAHGRMDKNALEDRIQDFIDRKTNVLVCTTIIETGIDIPNANTLIIDDATRLGLSQLYQLRGRVGRSDRIAYAYLFYDENKRLGIEASERLAAIRDFTELGSGFKIAKRDLAIRGSGDILGAEQSGFIDSVGYDMYMRILKETIDEKNGIVKNNEVEVFKSIYTDRHIPKEYINDDGIRIDIHKRIDSIKSEADIFILEEELKDRFGSVDNKLMLYMYEKLMNSLLDDFKANISAKTNNLVTITFPETSNGTNIFKASMKYTKEIKITYNRGKINVIFDIPSLKKNWIIELCKFLTGLKNL